MKIKHLLNSFFILITLFFLIANCYKIKPLEENNIDSLSYLMPDKYEPDDSSEITSNELIIGETQYHLFSDMDDFDCYKINIIDSETDKEYVISVENNSNSFNFSYYLICSDTINLKDTFFYQTQDNLQIHFFVSSSNLYYFKIWEKSGLLGEYSITLTTHNYLINKDIYETMNDNSSSSSNYINVSEVQNHTLHNPYDKDDVILNISSTNCLYYIEATITDWKNVFISYMGSSIEDSNSKPILMAQITHLIEGTKLTDYSEIFRIFYTNSSQTFLIKAEYLDSYLIEFYGYSYSNAIQPLINYSITIGTLSSPYSVDLFEPDNGPINSNPSFPIGTTQSHTIYYFRDIDYLKIDISDTSKEYIFSIYDINSLNTNYLILLQLIDKIGVNSLGSKTFSINSSTDTYPYLSYTFSSSGEYFLRILDYRNDILAYNITWTSASK